MLDWSKEIKEKPKLKVYILKNFKDEMVVKIWKSVYYDCLRELDYYHKNL